LSREEQKKAVGGKEMEEEKEEEHEEEEEGVEGKVAGLWKRWSSGPCWLMDN